MTDLPQSSVPPLLTVVETCEQLRVSRWMVYRLIQRRELRTIKIGRRRLIHQSDLKAFLVARQQESAS